MKNFLIMLSLLFMFILNVNASSSIDELNNTIKWYNNLIEEAQNNQISLSNEKNKIKEKYATIIEELKKSIEIAQQQSAIAYNKMWLWFSSWIEQASKAIEAEWNEKISALEDELNKNLDYIQSQIDEYWNKITEYKEKIEDINKLKKEINTNQEEQEKNQKIFTQNFDKWWVYFWNWDYVNAIKYYERAIEFWKWYWDLYACYFNLWLSYEWLEKYEQAKIVYYKALDYTDTNERKAKLEEKIEVMKKKINEEDNKPDEDKLKDKLKQKAEQLFINIDKKLSKLDVTKKVKTYEGLIIKLNKYKIKSKNAQLNTLIDLLVEEMENYINENTDLDNSIMNIINN